MHGPGAHRPGVVGCTDRREMDRASSGAKRDTDADTHAQGRWREADRHSGHRKGRATDITEGKIDGMDVSFKATRAGRNGNATTTYTGKLMGDDLKLTPTREGGAGGKGGGAQELDFKRTK